MMTIIILLVILIGTVIGYFIYPSDYIGHIDFMIDITLYITLFFVGIGIGLNKSIFKKLKSMGLKILVLPLGTIIGSLIGGLIAGLLVNQTLFISLAIASGFGWYSLSAGLLSDLSGAEIGAIAFLSNVFREVIAFIAIPILGKKISPYTAISVGGATSMDTTLPLISKSTSEHYAVISFIHGATLSFIVPFLVTFFANL